MPVPALKKMASDHHTTLAIAEQKWEEAKEIASKQYPDMDKHSDSYWAVVTTITKAKLKGLDAEDTKTHQIKDW
jgi:hypothetical protein